MIRVIVPLLVFLILVITNPSPQRHQAAIRDAIQEKSSFAGALVGFVQMFGEVTAYQSFGVVSYTSYQGEIYSVGLCGYVWVSPAVTRGLRQKQNRK